MNERRFDLDWLRAVSMLIIFFFHNARFFDNIDWHLKNSDESMGFTIFVGFLVQWIMPMFFLISGAGSWFALDFGNSKHYLIERVKRLLVPFYIVGFLILIPPQYYWEQVTHFKFAGDFFQFIPHYFHYPVEPQFFGFYLGFRPTFLCYWSGHLWFLRYLFILSLIALPLMKYLKSESGRRLIIKLAGVCQRRGGIFLFVVPIALVQIALRAAYPNYLSWADFAYWLVCFLIGYVIPADHRFTEAIKQNSWSSLIIGTASFMLIGYSIGNPRYFDLLITHPSYNGTYVVYQVLCSLNTWCWIVFVFSVVTKFLNFNNKILSYCNEAVLPFYILHQTIILTVGFFIIQWNLNAMLKYLIISTCSFALIMTIYELLIKQFKITRFLFGMQTMEKAKSKLFT